MESEACNTQKCGEFRKFVTPLQDGCSVKRSPVRTPTLVGPITVICPSRNSTLTHLKYHPPKLPILQSMGVGRS